MGYIKVATATEAWENWFQYLLSMARNGFSQPSRAGNVVGEELNSITIITNPRKGIVESKIRDLSMSYAVGELMWYMSGSNKVSDISKYSKVWDRLSDDGETVNSAYGYRIHHQFGFDQWEHVKKLLSEDPMSRQDVIHIKDASNKPTKDMPCTVALQYQIREGKLYATTFMRSNDLWFGFPYDVFTFTAFQVKLAMELGVDVGEYTHIASSLHLYEKDAKKYV